MTAVLHDTDAGSDAEEVARDRLASWLSRAGAFAVDVLSGVGVMATMALVAWSTPQGDWLWWVCTSARALVFLAMAVNRWLLPKVTGFSVGRALFGIAVVHRDGSPVGPWRLLVRDFAHLLDTLALFVGWLWPLWDSRRRTFADLLVRTEVRRVDGQRRDARKPAAVVLLVAALLSAAGAGLGYLVVYRHDHAIDRAREQIAVQGPKIVEDMLSYNTGTLQADFTHAQSLATDSYRPQLIAQQQTVQKAGAISNDYWVTNSAVLSASADRATMLLLMQGQRGTAPQQRFITATVRVDFEKSADGQWRVANLSVLAKPHPNGSGK